MEKTFSKIEISVIKTTAKNAAQYVAKKQKVEAQIAEVEESIKKKIEEKIAKLKAEKDSYQSIIDSLNEPVKRITGGFTTEDLVTIEKVGTGKMDEKGKEIMQTRYALKYPETVVPPTNEAEAVAEAEQEIPEEALTPTPEDVAVAEEAANNPFEEEWN